MEVYGNTRGSGSGPGKGDKRRPTDETKFRNNFDEIDWGHKPKIEMCYCGVEIGKHPYNGDHVPSTTRPICCCPNPKPCGCPDGTCMNCGRTLKS